jgi:hypothetical protein
MAPATKSALPYLAVGVLENAFSMLLNLSKAEAAPEQSPETTITSALSK